ncbi:c-type cytochrome [Massilia niabensis]|uniref:C-type cytochrome n=1 Tax=Massilia niabensis TaxID=544910 RepID=A0ABW0L5M4_9BURK
MRNQSSPPALPPARLLQALGLCLALTGCGERTTQAAVKGGDPVQGQRLMAQYQCTACHAIPDVPGAAGNFGPPLEGFGRRSYIAGGIPNTPDALTRWLDNPQSMKPGTPMPDLGVSPGEARHMAAYLATLR